MDRLSYLVSFNLSAVLDDCGLDAFEFRVFSHIRLREKDNGYEHPTQEDIISTLRLGAGQFQAAVDGLVARGFLARTESAGSIIYRTLDEDSWELRDGRQAYEAFRQAYEALI